MRRTPPVVVHIEPQPAVQVVVATIAVLAAGGLGVWLISHQSLFWPVLLAVPAVSWWAWRAAAALPRRLRWDGEAWWLAEPGRDDEVAVRLSVLMDLDRWLLLRAKPGPRWLSLSRDQHKSQWGALRATLFAARSAAEHR